MMKKLPAILCSIALVGCMPLDVSHSNWHYRLEYTRNYEAGEIAEQNNDVEQARLHFSRAILHARRGYLGPESEAWATYEWARVTGYLGDYEESKRAFLEAIELLEESKGKNHPAIAPMLCELGYLYQDNGFHADATATYSRALPALEYVYVVEKSDPIGYAILLEAYAESLKEIDDQEESERIYQKAQNLRKNNANKNALYIPKRYKKSY